MVGARRPRPGDRKPTVIDIARAAGVSTATVSRVLNGSALVRPELRAKVEAEVQARSYVRHGAARALASNRSGAVGAVIPTLNNAIFATGIESFERRLAEAGCTLLVAVSNYSLEREAQQVGRLLERGVDAIMLIGSCHHAETFSALASARIPFVCTWTHDAGNHPAIGFDNHAAVAEIVRHLVDLGHRHIAMIAGITEGNDRAADRVRGVRGALAACGLPQPGCFLIEEPYTIEAARSGFARLMSVRPRPTAIICGNDVLALGALFEAAAMDIAVPGSVSITGFDNLPLAAHVRPALTTVDVPSEAMGRKAAEALLEAVAHGRAEIPSLCLPAPLLLRGTTSRPAVDAVTRSSSA